MADQTDRVLSFSFLCTAYHLYHIRAHEKSVPLFTAHFDMHSRLYPILFRIKLAFGNDYTLRGYILSLTEDTSVKAISISWITTDMTSSS